MNPGGTKQKHRSFPKRLLNIFSPKFSNVINHRYKDMYIDSICKNKLDNRIEQLHALRMTKLPLPLPRL